MKKLPSIVVIAGPTASGKSALALELAIRLEGEIINADSQQIYRHLDIGTAKPDQKCLNKVPHHLMGIISPEKQLSAADFVEMADKAIGEILSEGRTVFVAGGSGLWLRALLRGLVEAPARNHEIRLMLEKEEKENGKDWLHSRLSEIDPESALRLHPNDTVRIIRAIEVFMQSGRTLSDHIRSHLFSSQRYRYRLLALSTDIKKTTDLIEKRTTDMLERGWVEETRSLIERNLVSRNRLSKILGYREVLDYIDGNCGFDEMKNQIIIRTRRYAKRQVMWLRKERDVEWVNIPPDIDAIVQFLRDWLPDNNEPEP